jgi:hypothetical protein
MILLVLEAGKKSMNCSYNCSFSSFPVKILLQAELKPGISIYYLPEWQQN